MWTKQSHSLQSLYPPPSPQEKQLIHGLSTLQIIAVCVQTWQKCSHIYSVYLLVSGFSSECQSGIFIYTAIRSSEFILILVDTQYLQVRIYHSLFNYCWKFLCRPFGDLQFLLGRHLEQDHYTIRYAYIQLQRMQGFKCVLAHLHSLRSQLQ